MAMENSIDNLVDSLEDSHKKAVKKAKVNCDEHVESLIEVIFKKFKRSIEENPTDKVLRITIAGNKSDETIGLYWKSFYGQCAYESIPFTVYTLKKTAKVLNKINCRLFTFPRLGFTTRKNITYEFCLVVSKEPNWIAEMKDYILRSMEFEETSLSLKVSSTVLDLCAFHEETKEKYEYDQQKREEEKRKEAMLFIDWLTKEFEILGKRYPLKRKYMITCSSNTKWFEEKVTYYTSEMPDYAWRDTHFSNEQVERAVELLKKNNKSLKITRVEHMSYITRYVFEIRL